MEIGPFDGHIAVGGVALLLVLSGCGAIGSGGMGPGDGIVDVTVVENTGEVEGVVSYDGSELSGIDVLDETVREAIDDHERGDDESTTVTAELDQSEVEQVRAALEETDRHDPEGYPSGEYYATEE